MTVSELKNEIKSPSGVYLFYGEEEYLKHYYLTLMRESVLPDESLAVFNHTVLTGEEELYRLSSACDMLPVMAEKKLIEIHSVKYTVPKKKGDDKPSGGTTDMLVDALSGATDGDTVVVLYAEAHELDAGYGKNQSDALRALSKVAKPVEFARQTPAKLASWVGKHFARAGIEASQSDCLFMVSYCSSDMFGLENETQKLIAYLEENSRSSLSRDDIINVCPHTDEIAAFDFSNALLDGNTARAYTILSDMKSKKQKPEMILGSISSVYMALLRLRVFSDAGMTTGEMAKNIGWKEGRVQIYLRAAKKRSAKALESAVRACHAADIKMKTSQISKFGILTALVSDGI